MKKEELMETDMNEGPQFVIAQKVEAFVRHYIPCKDEMEADEIFTDARLRQYFQAYSRPTGDPLVDYVDQLSHHGFQFHTIITGEPAICVNEKW